MANEIVSVLRAFGLLLNINTGGEEGREGRGGREGGREGRGGEGGREGGRGGEGKGGGGRGGKGREGGRIGGEGWEGGEGGRGEEGGREGARRVYYFYHSSCCYCSHTRADGACTGELCCRLGGRHSGDSSRKARNGLRLVFWLSTPQPCPGAQHCNDSEFQG